MNEMKSKCDRNAIEIISLQRPTTLDKLSESIPKPKGAIPNFGLPKWKVMPLESKIPMVPGPEGAYNFARNKLGKRLWIAAEDAEFDLSDPYCYEMNLTYDSLHDKHLIPFFSKKHNIQTLIRAGLVTKTLDAKCSLRDYNMYRKYLRKIFCDSVKKELRRTEKWNMEEKSIKYAQDQAQKEVKRLQEREQLVQARRALMARRKRAERMRLRRQEEKQRMVQRRLEKLDLEKRKARQLQYAKSKERAESLRQKRKAAADNERRKIIRTLVEWSKKEQFRKKTRDIRLAEEREQTRRIVEQKWQTRQEFQKKQIEKEQFLLECIDSRRKQFIAEYQEKIDKETERMNKLLEGIKMYIRCYMARYTPGSREKICCAKYYDEDLDTTVGGGKKRQVSGRPSIAARQLLPDVRKHSVIKKRTPQTSSPVIKRKKDKTTTKEINRRQKDKRWSPKRAVKTKGYVKSGEKKRTKRKRKGKKKLEKEESVIEATASPSDRTPESESKGMETPDSAESATTFKDKCRCQVIKNLMYSATT